MDRGSGRSASSARRACATRARLPSSAARRRPCRASYAIRIDFMADEPLTDMPDAPAASETSALADLQRERDDFKDRWLRKSAEFDNYRKRIERERREQADQAVIDILQDLLLVVDDFDRALMADSGA